MCWSCALGSTDCVQALQIPSTLKKNIYIQKTLNKPFKVKLFFFFFKQRDYLSCCTRRAHALLPRAALATVSAHHQVQKYDKIINKHSINDRIYINIDFLHSHISQIAITN